MYNFVFNLGAAIINLVNFFVGHSKFCIKVCVRGIIGSKFINPAVNMAIVRQIYFAGVELFYIMTFISIVVGIAIVGELSKFLILVGAKESIGTVLLTVIIRSAAPIITGLLLMLRTSTAILMEVGLMKHNRELIALDAMNIDPYIYVYFPRILAGVISMVVLSTYFSLISIMGGYILLSFQLDTTLDSILGQVVYEINLSDVLSFLFQTVLIGFLIGSIPIYTAISTKGVQTDIIKSFVYGMIRLFLAFILIVILGQII